MGNIVDFNKYKAKRENIDPKEYNYVDLGYLFPFLKEKYEKRRREFIDNFLAS